MRDDKLIYKELSYKIIGTLFDVSNELGFGYQEKYFEKAVENGLTSRGLKYQKQVPFKLTFQGKTIGYYRLDFLIENKVILEIKTGKRFAKKDFDQVKGYLKATGKKLAILAIFTHDGVRFYRVLNLENEIEQEDIEINTIKLRKLINL